jgi:hypothetical protein
VSGSYALPNQHLDDSIGMTEVIQVTNPDLGGIFVSDKLELDDRALMYGINLFETITITEKVDVNIYRFSPEIPKRRPVAKVI